ncbi:hypothetical protein HOB87_05700 [Candidatus Woesearchaeota archaeon]|nr:hypothetical protein [Candidatus Woesearchaeota archaeon]MBT5111760.1 hypothetical protein [Candidatus Woesearchaeota archaeon]MBT7148951.1 hypothetical protein [Candidatus Woesearchaeota archaeon]
MKQKQLAVILTSILILSLLVPVVLAEEEPEAFDPTASYEWLIEHCRGGNCDDSIFATSFYAMAMKLAGYGNSYGVQAIKYIQSEKKDSVACFPKGNCNIKDTAAAYWALSNYGEDTSEIEAYIESELGTGLAGNWWLQIATSAQDKTCTIAYPAGETLEQVDIQVDEGTFPGCTAGQPPTFFDLNSCIAGNNLIDNNPLIELTIDCSSIGEGTTISIIYNTGSSYYITEQATTSKYKTQIPNACHKQGATCHKDTSLWANWILTNKNSEINTNLYLLDTYDSLKPADTSLLYLSTTDTSKKSKYLQELLDIQRLDGSFNKNNFETGVALMTLIASASTEEITSAISYLESSVNQEGAWDADEATTAIILYTAFAGASVDLPETLTPPGDDSSDESICGDNVCNPLTENEYSCPSDCETTTLDLCVEDGVCDYTFGETNQNCPSDCFCGDNVCQPSEESSCSLDCGETTSSAYCGNDIQEAGEECDGYDDSACLSGEICNYSCECESLAPQKSEGGFGTIFMVFLIIIFVGIAAFIAFKNYFGKKPKPKRTFGNAPVFKPTGPTGGFGTPQPKFQSRRAPPKTGKSSAEKELEKSLSEARKLLGGK